MASIDKRPNGQWRARWREYPGGPQKAQHFARKVDAEQHLVKQQHDLMTGAYVNPSKAKTTVGAFAPVHLDRQPWRAATRSAADKAFVHILATFGDRPIGSVRKGDVQSFVSRLKLAPGTVGLVLQHLNAMLEAAIDDGLIARNPAKGVRLPARPVGEVAPPTVEQVSALYDARRAGSGRRSSSVQG